MKMWREREQVIFYSPDRDPVSEQSVSCCQSERNLVTFDPASCVEEPCRNPLTNASVLHVQEYIVHVYYWRAKRAYLVVRMARFFYNFIIHVYISSGGCTSYICACMKLFHVKWFKGHSCVLRRRDSKVY